MKTYKAVKTEEKAIKILQNWLNENLTEDLMSADTIIESTTTKCECGETTAWRAFYEGGDKLAVVSVCDCCGDDNNFENEVLEII